MDEKNELAPHIEDITRVLGEKVEEEQVRKELRTYLDTYKLPLAMAKNMLVKKYGGKPQDLSEGIFRTLSELGPNEQSVDLLVRFVSVNPKDIEVEGRPKSIIYGILGDQTTTVPFTAWETADWKFQKGDTVSVQNAYTTEWQGKPQVNFGMRTVLTKEAAEALPAYSGSQDPFTAKVEDLADGVRNVTFTGRILSVESRQVNVRGEEKTVFSGIVADETGKVQFSAWSDFGLAEGDVIKVEGAYVKAWRGIPQLSFDDNMELVKVADDALPSLEELRRGRSVPIESIAKRGGACCADVEGVVIDIRAGSGLIMRCPECRRVLQKSVCRIHGEVEGWPDLRVKAVLDDGTGALTVVMGREITEDFLGRSLEECQARAKEAMDQGVIADDLHDLLVAKPLRVTGDVSSDDFGMMLVAKGAEPLKTDVQAEARALLEELEVA